MRTRLLTVLAGLLALGLSGRAARADMITATSNGASCSACPAATYTVTATGSGSSYTVSLNILLTGSASGIFISAVDVGLGTGSMTGTLASFTANGVSGNLADWATSAGPINSTGSLCNGTSSEFICSSTALTSITPATAGDSYTWTWNVTVPSGSLTADNLIHIGANYDPHQGWIISDTTTAPEPATYLMFGLGLLGLMLLNRRRLHA